MEALRRYAWPGNVRELNNVLERAILLCDDTEIHPDDLPESIAETAASAGRRFGTGFGAGRPAPGAVARKASA